MRVKNGSGSAVTETHAWNGMRDTNYIFHRNEDVTMGNGVEMLKNGRNLQVTPLIWRVEIAYISLTYATPLRVVSRVAYPF